MPRPPLLLALLLLTILLGAGTAQAEDGEAAGQPLGLSLSAFGRGTGPRAMEGVPDGWHLLDEHDTRRQSNAVALHDASDRARPAARASLRCKLRVLEGGDGGAFVFLNSREYGQRGPAPFVKSWVEPNLKGTFAVGIDVHNPPDEEMFSAWGNYQDLPQREISLHYDGRELVKRVAPKEFRGNFADLSIDLVFVAGGAEVTVKIADGVVYDRHFLAHVTPYPMRLAMGAGTRADATTRFDVKELVFSQTELTTRPRPPLHVEVFNHVLTNNSKVFYDTVVDLPPREWAFERVILTLDIHDAGKDWDEWDRNGEISIFDAEGRKLGIVPFITSYRTPCHWKVDVTHFRPWLTGKCRIEVRAGTSFYKNRGYMMSVSLDYHHGTPEHTPVAIQPLWHGTAKYKSAENHFQDFFPPQEVTIPAGTTQARIFTTTTGHSQIGEFTPSKRAISFEPAEGKAHRVENTLWKADVYLNPNRPQFGTWKFSRAGWAPGDIVHPWWIDLTPHMGSGGEATVRYEAYPYEFEAGAKAPGQKEINKASHVVRSYLVLYGPGGNLVAAPTLRIGNVTKGSNAAKAGVKAGDYLAEYDGKRIDSLEELRAALKGAADREGPVPATLYRGTQRIEITMQPGRMGISLGR
ncbi:MAG: peptide-N-glycosidase F-related protein [Planctomycetota bacterium]|nr:peptide-N-glycosidase F-related protein [Planctomycetota bacterium]